ncbi:MAG: N-acetylated-alpha-linked acidic dipeptidase [Chlamydiales bacterium]|jgi:N-acetylated-alpha-linked acidic dipeptidase
MLSPFALSVTTLLLLAPGLPIAAGVQTPAAEDNAPPARELLRELTSATRLAGTSGSRRAAEWLAGELVQAGLDVELDVREVLLSLPHQLDLQLFEDALADKPFHEHYASFDPDQVPAADIPPFSAWTASGEVRAAVIDAGHGLHADYERLRAAGVDPAGKVALVRYGRAYRGVKVEIAAELGCKAVLLFSDPEGDGAAKGDTWPKGRWKPDWAVQRGAILEIASQPGDPSTPGFASPAPGETASRKRLHGAELEDRLPSIPCLPIGAAQAARIIEKLRMRRVAVEPADGEGEAEKVRMRVGPGPVEAFIRVDAPRTLRPIVNVIARIDGLHAQTVLLGNHRDAWVRGAHDAGSGTIALLRAAQRLGQRARDGWRPERSIAFAFWDAEEFGLIGSTEWAEANADWVRDNLLAYVNGDAVVGGARFHASGSPGMESVLARALAGVPDPSDGTRSLAQTWLDADGAAGQLRLPGSGSDFTAFAHHLQVPVLDLGFGGSGGGQYHTRFDDFSFVERFIDPDFQVHETAGALFAALATEIASAGPLALDEAWAAHELARHARAAADAIGAEPAERLATAFEALESAVKGAWNSWSEKQVEGASSMEGMRRGEAPSLDQANASSPEGASTLALDALALTSLRERLFARLDLPSGLSGRPWYQNRLWAPSLDSGYAAETFPLLRQGAGDAQERARHLSTLLDAIDSHRETWTARLPTPE